MKYSKEDDAKIIELVEKQLTYEAIGKELGRNAESIRSRYKKLRKDLGVKPKVINSQTKVEDKVVKKTGLEVRHDGKVVINWTSQTIITELGEFGEMKCSFDMHKAIQRNYVVMGENETAAIVAMKFDFAHAKAVHLYAKLHGFTKSSLPQTDIEFESGTTVEDAVRENIQTMKREAYKKTEKAKWNEIMKGYEKYTDFHNKVLKPFENHIEEYLPKHKIKPLKLSTKKKKSELVSIVGISDVHYMKNCFDAFGRNIYNRKIAEDRLFKHAKALLDKTIASGDIPTRFVLPIGSDNLHIDNPVQTTTRGTNQSNSTDGQYRIALGDYFDMTRTLIETFAQVAPVDVVSVPGNHDNNTSLCLSQAMRMVYEKEPRVNVIIRHLERTYLQYGKTCIVISHGDKMSISRMKNESHKLILAEAREQGIKVGEIENWVFAIGHLHHEEMIDLGGNTELIVLPSMSEEDDWHSDSGYVGAKKNSMLITYDYELGKQGIIYAGKEKI